MLVQVVFSPGEAEGSGAELEVGTITGGSVEVTGLVLGRADVSVVGGAATVVVVVVVVVEVEVIMGGITPPELEGARTSGGAATTLEGAKRKAVAQSTMIEAVAPLRRNLMIERLYWKKERKKEGSVEWRTSYTSPRQRSFRSRVRLEWGGCSGMEKDERMDADVRGVVPAGGCFRWREKGKKGLCGES